MALTGIFDQKMGFFFFTLRLEKNVIQIDLRKKNDPF